MAVPLLLLVVGGVFVLGGYSSKPAAPALPPAAPDIPPVVNGIIGGRRYQLSIGLIHGDAGEPDLWTWVVVYLDGVPGETAIPFYAYGLGGHDTPESAGMMGGEDVLQRLGGGE